MIYYLALLHVGLLLTLLANFFYVRRGRRRVVPERYPAVSLLIPARNEEENLRRLLPSLLTQDYPDFEVIVYDDGSDDGTWAALQAVSDTRVKTFQGNGPPTGWIGKIHALYQATRHATGALYLFLDADTALLAPSALRSLVERFLALPPDSVMTGLVDLRGGGLLLVSLVPNAILSTLPWHLVRPLPFSTLGAVNGQCWLLDAEHYKRFEPHLHLKDEVLEDVKIGRYLKGKGITPVLLDVQREVAAYLYRDLAEAWRGFRKNAYLIMSGKPISFVLLAVNFFLTYLFAPFVWPWFLLSIYLIKAITDRQSGFPLWVTLLAPLSFLMSPILQFDSAFHHWTGRVSWKGRRVG